MFFSRAERGFSLLELMIGTLIGLIGLTWVTQIYLQNQSAQRTTISEGGVNSGGAYATSILERDLRMAGFGIQQTSALNCPTLTSVTPNITIAPAVITQGAGNLSDSITILSSGNIDRPLPSALTAPMQGGQLVLSSTTGFNAQDIVLIVPQSNGTPCALVQVNAAPSLTQQITLTPNLLSLTGTLPNYQIADSVFSLGPLTTQAWRNPLTLRTYDVDANNAQLRGRDLLVANTLLPIADGIVNLQAEYAFDNGSDNGTISATTYVANDGIVDQYSIITPTTAAQWLQLLGVRFALLVRIGNEEKPNAANQCTTPTTALNYFTNRAFTLPTQPPCYRYRVFETIVPLRNALWRPA